MDPSHKIIQNQEKPISVREIKVEGISTTNDRFLKAATKELLEAESVGDVIIGSRNVANRFKKMDMFKDVSVSIEGVPDDKNGTACNIVFKVVEAPRLYAHTGADFGSHDGNMVGEAQIQSFLSIALT
jgi:outer membrane protein assembly factor BamA